ncbi:hypothetical protein K402DRAFT_90356 [Aulographum hederae CBS 113979]|uniref:Uncharacterized protein n=1 Tax=Aulographum hederae CBS 113979 TaxID=1176131 RepID=A0A6G1GZG5_9PEZI|nr:hypothetical protein K402DRAFT_90356 [Aulographum hederae CBS 113979]
MFFKKSVQSITITAEKIFFSYHHSLSSCFHGQNSFAPALPAYYMSSIFVNLIGDFPIYTFPNLRKTLRRDSRHYFNRDLSL